MDDPVRKGNQVLRNRRLADAGRCSLVGSNHTCEAESMGILTTLIGHFDSPSGIDNSSSIDSVAIEPEHVVGHGCRHLGVDSQKGITTSNWSSVPNNGCIGSEELWQVLSVIVESLEELTQKALRVMDGMGDLLLGWGVVGVHVV